MRNLIACLLFVAIAVSAAANAPDTRPSKNIARGASYTMSPKPGYSYCTDPGDAKQLTDGVYTKDHFWTQKTTVGWKNARPVIITIDLGTDQPIRGVSFNSAAGTAGVSWPVAIHVCVAGEDKLFHDAGGLVSLSGINGVPPAEGYAVHRFWTDKIRTHGRYIAFVFAAVPYGFVDEIEVYQGEAEWASLPLKGPGVADLKTKALKGDIQAGVIRRLRADLHAIRKKVDEAKIDAALAEELKAELDRLEPALLDVTTDLSAQDRIVLPVNPMHEQIFEVQARLWQAQGLKPLTAWRSSLWGHLRISDDPPRDPNAAMTVHMMRNEYRAMSFNISNATAEAVEASLRITGLPGGVNPGYITVHEVAWTDTKAGVPVAAALPEATLREGAYRLTVPAGMTRQVWMTFSPTDIEHGAFTGAVELESVHGALSAPLTLTLFPFRFPDTPTLHFGGWDYTNGSGNRGINTANMAAVLKHLQEHFVDSPWATNAVMPHGAYNADGSMKEKPDTAKFDEWIARWPEARQYMVFSNVPDTIGGLKMGTPAFNTAVKNWALFWAEVMRKRGHEPKQLALLLVDEPRAHEQDARIAAWARAIHAADTGILVWEDPIYDNMAKALPDLAEVTDVFCPNRPIWLRSNQAYHDYYIKHRDAGGRLEFYSCSGPVRSLDPYAYHRLQAWTCWKYQATGTYFWAFGDSGKGSSWNEYAAAGRDFCPMFLDAKSVTAAKHMEAAREGVEDYEYFVMLRDALAKAEKEGADAALITQTKALLEALPGRVLEGSSSTGLYWIAEIDRDAADQARLMILKALMALAKKD